MPDDGTERGGSAGGVDTAQAAAFWGVTTQTIRNWLHKSAPLGSDVAMARWLGGRRGLSDATQIRIDQIRRENPDEFPRQDPDWVAYQKVKAERSESGAPLPFQSLEAVRDFFAYKLELAVEKGDRLSAEFATSQLISIDRAIRENQLLDKKLGKELGDTISRDTSERWIRSWVFWTMRGVDKVLVQACPKISGMAQGVTVDQVRQVLEPALLEQRILLPFANSAKTASRLQAPAWAIACAKDAVDDYLEDGGAQFDEAKAAAP